MDGDAALREAVADDGVAGERDTARLLVERGLCLVAVTQANEVVDRDAWSGGDAEPGDPHVGRRPGCTSTTHVPPAFCPDSQRRRR